MLNGFLENKYPEKESNALSYKDSVLFYIPVHAILNKNSSCVKEK